MTSIHITSATQYLDHLATVRQPPSHSPPDTVVVIFSRSHLKAVLASYTYENSDFLSHLYLLRDGEVGLVGGFGIGAPALIHRMEELIAFGVKRFLLVGLAGSLSEELSIGDYALCTHALSEDGVGHLYMKPQQTFSSATPQLSKRWLEYVQEAHPNHAPFHPVKTWSFPVIFRESHADVARVRALRCQTVEMETGAFYAIAEEKGVEALALFLMSDSLAGGVWNPRLQEMSIKEKLRELTDMAIDFSSQLRP
jgi:purine-nucleoside phosphorylase